MVIPLPLNRWWGWLFSELFLEEYLIAESAAMVIQTRASAFIVILLYAMSRYEIGELRVVCTYVQCTFLVSSLNIASGGGLGYYELLGHPSTQVPPNITSTIIKEYLKFEHSLVPK